MSVRVMSDVWGGFKGDETEKIVLLAIADSCNDEGCFVTDVDLIASKCSLSIEQTREVLGSLIAAAWLIAEDSAPSESPDCRIALDRLQSGSGQRGAT